MPKDLHDALRTLAFATDKSVNEVAIRAIADFLAARGHQETVRTHLKRAQEQYRVALDKLADM